jgi:hypothetical protein
VNDGHFGYFTKSLNKIPGHNMPMMWKTVKKLVLEDMFNLWLCVGKKPTFCANFSANVLHHGAGIEPRTSPAGNVALTSGILSGAEQASLLQTQTQKVKTLKTLRQNNAVLRRAALSGQKRLAFLTSTTCYCSFIPTT